MSKARTATAKRSTKRQTDPKCSRRGNPPTSPKTTPPTEAQAPTSGGAPPEESTEFRVLDRGLTEAAAGRNPWLEIREALKAQATRAWNLAYELAYGAAGILSDAPQNELGELLKRLAAQFTRVCERTARTLKSLPKGAERSQGIEAYAAQEVLTLEHVKAAQTAHAGRDWEAVLRLVGYVQARCERKRPDVELPREVALAAIHAAWRELDGGEAATATKKGRGRPPVNEKEHRQINDAWKTGYRTYADCARQLGRPEPEVARAVNRDHARQSRKRKSSVKPG